MTRRLPLFVEADILADLTQACARHGVPLATLEALVAVEQAHAGQVRRAGLPTELDAILATALGQDPALPDRSGVRAALHAAERELSIYEAAGDATLAQRTQKRLAALHELLPQPALFARRLP